MLLVSCEQWPYSLTPEQGKAIQRLSLSFAVKVLFDDAQADMLQHEVHELPAVFANCIDPRGHCPITCNKVRQISTHPCMQAIAQPRKTSFKKSLRVVLHLPGSYHVTVTSTMKMADGGLWSIDLSLDILFRGSLQKGLLLKYIYMYVILIYLHTWHSTRAHLQMCKTIIINPLKTMYT